MSNSDRASTSLHARVIRRSLVWDKPAVLALLAGAAIYALFAVAVLKQAAQIFAH